MLMHSRPRCLPLTRSRGLGNSMPASRGNPPKAWLFDRQSSVTSNGQRWTRSVTCHAARTRACVTLDRKLAFLTGNSSANVLFGRELLEALEVWELEPETARRAL